MTSQVPPDVVVVVCVLSPTVTTTVSPALAVPLTRMVRSSSVRSSPPILYSPSSTVGSFGPPPSPSEPTSPPPPSPSPSPDSATAPAAAAPAPSHGSKPPPASKPAASIETPPSSSAITASATTISARSKKISASSGLHLPQAETSPYCANRTPSPPSAKATSLSTPSVERKSRLEPLASK